MRFMKAAQIAGFGDSSVIKINEVEKPKASGGQVLVEIHAAAVNPFDWKIMVGYVKAPFAFPLTLGGDFSGKVVEANGVASFKKGDAVYGSALVLSKGSGSFAEYATADPDHLAKKPKKLDDPQSASLVLTGVSAYQALYDHMQLKKGQKVLIHGAAGGIGTAAVQMAKNIGAYVAATASERDLDFVKKLGADVAIDYKNQKFDEMLKDFDAVYDTVGGDTYVRSHKVLKKGGIIVSMLEQSRPELLQQYGVKAIAQGTHINTERLSKLAELIDKGVVKPQIDKSFPLEKAGEAMQYQQTGHPRGKIVLKVR
jgi:NADPH:quinone reductase-like Zn-dependent oxidoreductase